MVMVCFRSLSIPISSYLQFMQIHIIHTYAAKLEEIEWSWSCGLKRDSSFSMYYFLYSTVTMNWLVSLPTWKYFLSFAPRLPSFHSTFKRVDDVDDDEFVFTLLCCVLLDVTVCNTFSICFLLSCVVKAKAKLLVSRGTLCVKSILLSSYFQRHFTTCTFCMYIYVQVVHCTVFK